MKYSLLLSLLVIQPVLSMERVKEKEASLPAGVLSTSEEAVLLIATEQVTLNQEDRKRACHYPTILEKVLTITDNQEDLRDMLVYAVGNQSLKSRNGAVAMILPNVKTVSELPPGLIAKAYHNEVPLLAAIEGLPLNLYDRKKACHYPTVLEKVLRRTDNQEDLRNMLGYAARFCIFDAFKMILPNVKTISELPPGLIAKADCRIVPLLVTIEGWPLNQLDRNRVCNYSTVLEKVLTRTDNQEDLRNMLVYALEENLSGAVQMILPKVSRPPAGLIARSSSRNVQMYIVEMQGVSFNAADLCKACENCEVLEKVLTSSFTDEDLALALDVAIKKNLPRSFKKLRAQFKDQAAFMVAVSNSLKSAIIEDKLDGVFFVIDELGVQKHHVRDSDGNTLLHFTCMVERINKDLLGILLHADLDVANNSGETVLHLVARKRYLDTTAAEVAKSILSASKKSLTTKNAQDLTPACVAIIEDNVEVAKVLLAALTDFDVEFIDPRNNMKSSLLLIMATNPEYLEQLADAKLNVTAEYDDGEGILHKVVKSSHCHILYRLINEGAEVNKKTMEYGYTPLHVAVLRNNQRMIREMFSCSKDIDPSIVDKSGKTPLELARTQLPPEDYVVVKELFDKRMNFLREFRCV